VRNETGGESRTNILKSYFSNSKSIPFTIHIPVTLIWDLSDGDPGRIVIPKLFYAFVEKAMEFSLQQFFHLDFVQITHKISRC
jgi:hypothetical protein